MLSSMCLICSKNRFSGSLRSLIPPNCSKNGFAGSLRSPTVIGHGYRSVLMVWDEKSVFERGRNGGADKDEGLWVFGLK